MNVAGGTHGFDEVGKVSSATAADLQDSLAANQPEPSDCVAAQPRAQPKKNLDAAIQPGQAIVSAGDELDRVSRHDAFVLGEVGPPATLADPVGLQRDSFAPCLWLKAHRSAGRPPAVRSWSMVDVTRAGAEVQRHLAEINERGWTVLDDAVDPDLVDALADELRRLERELDVQPAGNSFEGTRTRRIYNLLARGELWWQIPVHAAVLPVVEAVLDPGCLVSSLSSINIGPGETAQPIHADDQLIPIPKPHPPTVCNTMWALTDFTAANGATRVVSGSHLADASPVYGDTYDSEPALLRRGSVLVWHGSLWHGGGSNQTDRERVGIAMNYCAGYIRQQENQQLGVPSSAVARMPSGLQELLGFGVYGGLIGHIDKRAPKSLLARVDGPSPMVWDLLG